VVIWRSIDWFVPPELLAESAESARRARSIVGFALVCVVCGLVFSVNYWHTMPPEIRVYIAGSLACFSLVTCVELILGRLWWPIHASGFTLYATLVASLGVGVWSTGGAESPVLWYYVLLPLIGLSEWTRVQALAAVTCGAVLLVAWHYVDTAAHPFGLRLPYDLRRSMVFSEQLGLFAAVAGLSLVYQLSKNASLQALALTNVALERAGEEARAASNVKSAFLANMSHEIRTPLTAILGFTDATLERFEVGSEEWDSLDVVRRNGQHLLELINEILDLSRIEADKLELECFRLSPFSLVSEVVSLMRLRTETNGIELHVQFTTPLPEVIETDPRRVRQILINLVGNAIKFTETGSVTLSTSLVQGDGGARIVFEVADTGIGMTEAQLRGLFVPFSQGDSSTSRKHGGSGLGLAISQSLARNLGGSISAESKVGIGSTFCFSIPTGVGPEVACVTQSHEATVDRVHPRAEVDPETVARCKDRRVLLADDGRDNQRLISLLLRRAGAIVTVVDNGQLAVDRALEAEREDRPYDIVLMDIQMPVLDGHAATRALRARGYTHPIVALTASAMAGDRERALASGCDDFLVKPIDREALLTAVADSGPSKGEGRR
jgi:signal transduction histidine kinase/ActR/RegA family two-component response regulator